MAAAAVISCGREQVAHGNGLCHSGASFNRGFFSNTAFYVVSDSTNNEHDIPVTATESQHNQHFAEIKRFYWKEDPTSAAYRPVRVYYEKRWKESDGKKYDIRYTMTGVAPVPK
ncbi:MAG: hypothetical protein HYV54_02680 [Parcubacteria group bacterium]|nr:hypothetical protein [Parcubacteria group bacterium]